MRRTLALTAAIPAAGYAAVQIANAIIRRHEDLDPDQIERPGTMVYVHGVGAHVLEQGSGPPILLIHGFGGGIFNFRHQIEPLARHFRAITVDLPGFGYADRPVDADLSQTGRADFLLGLMDRLNIERAAVVGHSMGGAIAMRLAARHPERVERLILVASNDPRHRASLPFYPLVRPFLPIPAAALAANPRIVRGAVRRIVYDPTFITDARWADYARAMRIRGTVDSLLKMVSDARHDAPLDPATVLVRTLLLWGEADSIVPLSVGHGLHAALPDARLEVVPRAGHLVLEEQPDTATEVMLRFLHEAPVPDPAVAP